jgi:hypothetical protein
VRLVLSEKLLSLRKCSVGYFNVTDGVSVIVNGDYIMIALEFLFSFKIAWTITRKGLVFVGRISHDVSNSLSI